MYRPTVRTYTYSYVRLKNAHRTMKILITVSIARSATHRYLIYSEADFEVFRPAGATRCIDWGEIWHGAGDRT